MKPSVLQEILRAMKEQAFFTHSKELVWSPIFPAAVKDFSPEDIHLLYKSVYASLKDMSHETPAGCKCLVRPTGIAHSSCLRYAA